MHLETIWRSSAKGCTSSHVSRAFMESRQLLKISLRKVSVCETRFPSPYSSVICRYSAAHLRLTTFNDVISIFTP
ncbi:hypothetical protein VIGAN_05064100 [Vigna angularis var. angularis]|uniref:Uncharacterized protein n=1 Tax=Vigna angularis var. angularis TaxID=157739 RepID=A0A0S3S369_PHAAN|nr:hypothetical protein VIGAN_05064100 [Vigna angularis var. angularis]